MKSDLLKFEEAALPHLGAAYNLARWLTHNDTDAEDVVQEAYLRALRHFDSFRGGDGRPWLLAIVRNTCYTWLQRNRTSDWQVPVDEETTENIETDSNPETVLLREANTLMVRRAVEKLPPEFREVIVLRELEELSYKQISEVVDVPIGTVMSRLARARKRLHRIITGEPTHTDELTLGVF
jgi:RNA polymerase sigma-70 factor (ECF subfamily)